MKLQFVPNHFKINGCSDMEIYSLIDPFLSLHPDNGTELRVQIR